MKRIKLLLLIIATGLLLQRGATSGNCGGWGGWSASTNCPSYR